MEPNGRVGKDNGQFQAQSSTREKPSHTKTARILDACQWKDTKLLRALATTEGGLVSDAVRRQAWPLLLGYPVPESIWNADEELEDWRTLPKHRDEGQVRLDVDRSFIYYPNNQSPKDLEGKKQELSNLITEVLRRQPYLSYFQGYHDICQVFLLVLDQSSRAAAVERLSMLRIRDFMLPKLRPALDQLNLIPAIIRASNIQLYNHLFGNSVGMEPFFALSGTLTMYAHDIQEYGEISRLFDVFLAREAVFSVYMFAQVVLQRSGELFEIPSDEPEMMHSILSKLPKPLNLEALISNSVKLFEKYPPENLPTWSRISKASVLKTARWPDQIERQSLEDGQAYFKLQARELQWAEKRAEALALLLKHRTPIRNVGITVLIGVLSFWVRRSSYFGSPGTFGAFGAHFQHWYYWYLGYPGH